MSTEYSSINLIFSSLYSRISGIQSGTIDYSNKVHPHHQIDILKEKLFEFDYSEALRHIDVSIKMIDEVKLELPSILHPIAFEEVFNHGSPGAWFEKKSAEKVRQDVVEIISTELSYYSTELAFLRKKVIRFIDEFETELAPMDNKIQTNLSVDQLGSLFRILIETDLLKETDKMELCRRISKTFASKRKTNISVSNLYTAMFDALDNTGFEYWSKKLPEMSGKILKIKRDK
ncbi:hypothetical protein CAP36_07855 [Chitinophagaceae bacterium IBVUCB2]|nr:hypothetical protein CAP36_07855 [Chitinophagaceae bacterium IBVUCB2]